MNKKKNVASLRIVCFSVFQAEPSCCNSHCPSQSKSHTLSPTWCGLCLRVVISKAFRERTRRAGGKGGNLFFVSSTRARDSRRFFSAHSATTRPEDRKRNASQRSHTTAAKSMIPCSTKGGGEGRGLVKKKQRQCRRRKRTVT